MFKWQIHSNCFKLILKTKCIAWNYHVLEVYDLYMTIEPFSCKCSLACIPFLRYTWFKIWAINPTYADQLKSPSFTVRGSSDSRGDVPCGRPPLCPAQGTCALLTHSDQHCDIGKQCVCAERQASYAQRNKRSWPARELSCELIFLLL